jgi:hypothetical protein
VGGARLVQQFMGGSPARGAALFGLFGTVWVLALLVPRRAHATVEQAA